MSSETGKVDTQFANTFFGELWSAADEGRSNGSQVVVAAAAGWAVNGAAMTAPARTVAAIAVANQRFGEQVGISLILNRREAHPA